MKIDYGLFSHTITLTWEDAIASMRRSWLDKRDRKKDFQERYRLIRITRMIWVSKFK